MQKPSKSIIKVTIILFCFIFNSSVANSKDEVILALEKKMTKVFPTLKFDKIRKTEVENIYEIHYGGAIIYITYDGKYIFEGGNLQRVEKEGKSFVFTNLTEISASMGRKNLLDQIKDESLFVYGNSEKKFISVVTDIDCPYCRKFHKDIPIYIESGVKVKYLVLTRKKSSKEKVISAWCSNNRNSAFTSLNNKEKIPKSNCNNPIQAQQDIISSLGVSSTPTIYLPDGTLILGYKDPKDIIEKLEN